MAVIKTVSNVRLMVRLSPNGQHQPWEPAATDAGLQADLNRLAPIGCMLLLGQASSWILKRGPHNNQIPSAAGDHDIIGLHIERQEIDVSAHP